MSAALPNIGAVTTWRGTHPCERLYWALLDPKAIGRVRIADDELPNLLESWLPIALEEAHASFVRLGDGRVVACAIARDELAGLDRDGIVSLVPASLPEELPAEVRAEIAPARLELLHGEFEAPALRSARRRWRASVAAVAALLAVAAGAGFARHARALSRAAEEVEVRRQELLAAAFADRAPDPRLPAEMRLVAELRELRGTRAAGVPVPFDAADALARLLAQWPEGIDARPEGVVVAQRSIGVRGVARGADETQRLADALAGMAGWKAEPPQFRSARDGVAFTVSLSPDDGAKVAPGGGR
ncbi:MAG: hypothetical protein U0572_01165 [Phycisphaerales bacterium]